MPPRRMIDTRLRVSVLLPAWNAEPTIRVALASVQRQTLSDWECLVVDDGSTDRTAEIAARFVAEDPRFRLISMPKQGLVSALNQGLGHCRARLIARMDADDVMLAERLASQARVLETDSTLAAVACHVRIFPRARMSPRLREYETWLNSLQTPADIVRDAFVECPVAHPTLMMRREMADLQYRERGWPEDYDLVLRALAAGLRIGTVSRRLHAWRDRPDGWCRTSPAYHADRFTACKAHYLAHGFLAARRSYVLWGYGETGRAIRRNLIAHGKTPSHIVDVKPTRINQRIHGAPVIDVQRLDSVRGTPIIVSVARVGPRTEIREALTRMAFVEGRDYVCAA